MAEHIQLRQTHSADQARPRPVCTCGGPWPCPSAWRVVTKGEPIGQRVGGGYVTLPAPADGVIFTEGLFVSDEDLANMRLEIAASTPRKRSRR